MLREFLAGRDVFCPQCEYNLRGLDQPRCPECGLAIRFPTATDESGMTEAERMALWLRDHDLICKKCKTNMRGQASNVCPNCGATYMLQHTTRVYTEPGAMPRGKQKTLPALLIVLLPLVLLMLCVGTAVLNELWKLLQQMIR